ncbi:hypothetical protein VOLCADRAFT_80128 [Volvox carteri f. nagariensis]|uniref:tRNA-dihydrouridine(16/17) synthase [NAD(P)(+)] n=1 Tax=Volvox carteri f. nagariensis TaxID=3068 RepID=D8TPE1_VOLCA|nr:uncharacterized protein VOLCADRAFT_80128 [Volvox carteri f. nagariensis]EFJ50748.1 hypothetical protein VOLCADRAFT_80128 [Volvox carteri f. nagariensis]|eukprot:XP_002948341.1 hypothetical protein VOLCADRAFT_80128 [Volvox carteri f. nagariensis]
MTVAVPPPPAVPASALYEPRTTMDAAPLQRPPHADMAWEWFRSIGSPKFHVAPMVDQSELPFRLLCRRHGATCAYTPMLHARIFSQDRKYREEMLTTCSEDRPLLVQFCAHEPQHLLAAARLVQDSGVADAIDINFGCPQRIAKRGGYGAFLMDDLPRVESLVRVLAQNLRIPVTAKIRIFPDLAKTVAYARMVEAAGASLVAVHGRLREQKDNSSTRADWDAIRAVKAALSVPVLANGNIRHLGDVGACLSYTGADGVLSAESLLADPALFDVPARASVAVGDVSGRGRWYSAPPLERLSLAAQYMDLVRAHPVPLRMVRGHVHKMVGDWLAEHTDLRDNINRLPPTIQLFCQVRVRVCGGVKEVCVCVYVSRFANDPVLSRHACGGHIHCVTHCRLARCSVAPCPLTSCSFLLLLLIEQC